MTPTEHLVEVYYRMCKKCLTSTDIKVIKGNNRQFDLLAYDPNQKQIRHIEISVTHVKGWNANLEKVKEEFDYKFFGNPKNKRPDLDTTDYAKGKTYRDQINMTYEQFGFRWSEIIRVWCLWYFEDNQSVIKTWKSDLARKYNLKPANFELLSMRDKIIPSLFKDIGTSNYDDEILRTISIFRQYEQQKVHNDCIINSTHL